MIDFEVAAHQRRVAEDFLDAPPSIRVLQMSLGKHRNDREALQTLLLFWVAGWVLTVQTDMES